MVVLAAYHQLVNFFLLMVVLASVKQVRKCASDTTSERSYSRGWGRGLPQEGPIGSCSLIPEGLGPPSGPFTNHSFPQVWTLALRQTLPASEVLALTCPLRKTSSESCLLLGNDLRDELPSLLPTSFEL